MGNIKISTKNIGGTEKASVQLVSGSVNIIEGTSFSGKSSLMRGVHLGLVGAPNEHRDEIERLHLNDTDPESHSPLLRRGSSEGLVVIEHDGVKIEAKLPISGRISGKGSNEKAVYTSMLSDLPKTNLYSAVFDEDNGDDFEWVSTVVSEAKHYIVWQNVLRPINQELVTIRAKFEQWKSSKGDGDARKEEIGEKLDELPPGSTIGTSSLRRSSQLLKYRGDLKIDALRGNIDTRLKKLDEGKYSAILLAAAGLNRLGWANRITEEVSHEILLPAMGQGALGIETRRDDIQIYNFISDLDHEETHCAVNAERALVGALDGGCQIPIGAYATVDGRLIRLRGLVASLDGKTIYKLDKTGSVEGAIKIGQELGAELLKMGAGYILKNLSQ